MGRKQEFREVYRTDIGATNVYKEEYKGKEIEIPPGGSILMERRDAVQFMAQYKPFDRENSMGEKPLAWRPANGKRPGKTLDVEIDDAPKFQNPANGKEFETKEALDEDLKQYSHLKLRKEED